MLPNLKTIITIAVIAYAVVYATKKMPQLVP